MLEVCSLALADRSTVQLLTWLGRHLKASDTECHERWDCPKSGCKAQLSTQNVVSQHGKYSYGG